MKDRPDWTVPDAMEKDDHRQFNDADDVGWSRVKAFCEKRLNDLDTDDADWESRRSEIDAVIDFIEENAP